MRRPLGTRVPRLAEQFADTLVPVAAAYLAVCVVDRAIEAAEIRRVVAPLIIIAGLAVGLAHAHARSAALFSNGRARIRSSYWMLGIMLGLGILGLWL